jgi:N,N-dimethylformamidase beta subunit-like, C-terminal
MAEGASTGRPVLGYCDRLTYRQGELVEVRASGYGLLDVSLVRLNHPPDDPDWPVPLTSPVDAVPAVRVTADPQPTYPGSYLHVDHIGPLGSAKSLTASMYMLPTRLHSGHPQALISTIDPDGSGGFALVIGADGSLIACWGRDTHGAGQIQSPVPLVQDYWHVVSVAFDEASGSVTLAHAPVAAVPDSRGRWTGSSHDPGLRLASEPTLLIGAGRLPDCPSAARLPGQPGVGTSFNGKIEQPVLIAAAVPADRLASLKPDTVAAAGEPIGVWDFARDQGTAAVADVSGNDRHGVLVNRPTRAVTGVRWRHHVYDWTRAPEEYAALHFHDDDMEDCRWPTTAELRLPDDLPTGVYGIQLIPADAGTADIVPVIVTPSGEASSRGDVLIVLPSFTYIAYANGTESGGDQIDYVESGLAAGPPPVQAGHDRLKEFPEICGSLYDVHSDGSGRIYSTPRRPVLTCRPDWKSSWRDAYRHLGADLYLMSWLDKVGVSYDVVTDHTVHEQGVDLLASYAACLTGSHPEYVSRRELDAFSGYLARGGSLFYLGGNGFYWVTAECESIPELVEVRRGFTGTRTWTSAPGECYHSLTGELGGLWKHRGLPPNLLTGVGMAAQGADGGGSAYKRTPASHEGPAAFLFEGVTAEVIGATGFDMGAAASDEVDRFDLANGSPPWGIVTASARELSRYYKLVVEELQISRENIGGDHEPGVRADLVLLEHEAGGFVFSVGSIGWIQSMAVGYFDSDTARVTENALRRALAHRTGIAAASQPSSSLAAAGEPG